MTVINTNTGSLYAQQALNTNARALETVTQQLSTGKRINNSVDDVAGMAISTRLTSQIRGLNQAVRNANDGISLIQTAEGATEQVTNMLQRMRELAVQSSNDTNNSNDRSFLDKELQQLKLEINRIASTTQWNGANILDGTKDTIKDGWLPVMDGKYSFQVGANSNQAIAVKLPNLQTYAAQPLTLTGTSLSVSQDYGFLNVDYPTSAEAQSALGRTFKITDDENTTIHHYSISQQDIDNIDRSNIPLGTSVARGMADAFNKQWRGVILGDYGETVDATYVGAVLTTTTSGAGSPQPRNIGLTSEAVGGELSAISDTNILSQANASSGLQAIDSALQALNAERANMGAVISRLQFASDNLANVSAKAQESRSRIDDTDYSQATTELAKRNIIQQAAQAMLAQANQAPQLVLQLLK